MMWQVLLSEQVNKFLHKQDQHTKDRLETALKKLKTDQPFHFLEHYEGKSYYKFRIGEYRALIDVDFQNKQLLVRILEHRGKIYERYR